MTPKEVKEQFGKVPITFISYYKYAFTYEGLSPRNFKIIATYGGLADDIYRHEVTLKPTCLDAEYGWTAVTIIDPNGKEIFEWDYQDSNMDCWGKLVEES